MSDPRQILIDIAYLDAGLVPTGSAVSTGRDGDAIKQALGGLSPEKSKKIRRRFRKYFRKALTWEINRIKVFYKFKKSNMSHAWRAQQIQSDIYTLQRKCGIILDPDKELSVFHRGNRRRLVNRYLRYTF